MKGRSKNRGAPRFLIFSKQYLTGLDWIVTNIRGETQPKCAMRTLGPKGGGCNDPVLWAGYYMCPDVAVVGVNRLHIIGIHPTLFG